MDYFLAAVKSGAYERWKQYCPSAAATLSFSAMIACVQKVGRGENLKGHLRRVVWELQIVGTGHHAWKIIIRVDLQSNIYMLGTSI